MEDQEDFTLIKEINAWDETKKHCIIKCTPKIRKAIYQHNDQVYTLYARCNAYDSYMPYQCYKCQDFGHSAKNCQNEQVCPKCGDNHKPNECENDQKKCINCVRKNREEVKHRAYDSYCTTLKEEKARVRNNTDHGF